MSNENRETSCCCGQPEPPSCGQAKPPSCGQPKPTSCGQVNTVLSKKETVHIDSHLSFQDYLGFVAMRLSYKRDRYNVESGLYSIGNPNAESPVLVTANYKMTFNIVRSHLTDVDAWILVLDTRGINVWCAAGKGTFGTEELIRQLEGRDIASVVSHRDLILPQLGGPGIAAHEVEKRTGFKVYYGPIRAKDIKPYLNAGRKVTPEMRQITFPFLDRIVGFPLEAVFMFKWFCVLAVFIVLLSGLHGLSYSLERVLHIGIPSVGMLTVCWLASGFLIMALLPWLPGRMLAVKGLCVGLFLGGTICLLGGLSGMPFGSGVNMGGLALIVVALSGYYGMNLTGYMPYTSLSGVKKEMRRTVPVIVSLFCVGILLSVVGKFV